MLTLQEQIAYQTKKVADLSSNRQTSAEVLENERALLDTLVSLNDKLEAAETDKATRYIQNLIDKGYSLYPKRLINIKGIVQQPDRWLNPENGATILHEKKVANSVGNGYPNFYIPFYIK